MFQEELITTKEYSEFTCYQLIGKTNLIQVGSCFDWRSKVGRHYMKGKGAEEFAQGRKVLGSPGTFSHVQSPAQASW